MRGVFEALLWISSIAIFCFFVAYTLVIFCLIGLSLYETLMQKFERGGVNFRPTLRPLRPGITIIAAAHNEQPVIVSSVRSMLASAYEPLEIVVVDDGSTDGTTDTLVQAFDLVELPVGDRFELETQPIEHIYVSCGTRDCGSFASRTAAARTRPTPASTSPATSWSQVSTPTPCSIATRSYGSSRLSARTPIGSSP